MSEKINIGSSIRSVGSIDSSIGSHKERQGSVLGDYDPEEGTVKLDVSESIKSVKVTMESEESGEESGERERKEKEGAAEHATNIDETHTRIAKKATKKNVLIRFEEATYKQDLQEQCFQDETTQQCWENAAKYDVDAEQLFSYVQVFTVSSQLSNTLNFLRDPLLTSYYHEHHFPGISELICPRCQ